MWIFSSGSFVSVVADRDNKDNLLVRARVAGHIEALFPQAKVFELEDADYKFRALVTREAAAQVMAAQVGSIGYDNFKNTISDPAYHSCCRDVWGVMYDLQETWFSSRRYVTA